ncbi:MAG: molecular chaperone Hsp70 [Pseudanabaena sp.]|nr:MAG: molecular chaperone Hsp70 [Pseudanabaena sp.]
MSKALGIDLGTTNSVGAFSEVEVEIVTGTDNTSPERKLTRSIVSCVDNQIKVGEPAYNNLGHSPENTINSIKRLVGRGFADPKVQEHKSKCAYKVTAPSDGTENSIGVWMGGKEYSPEDISAEILKKVVSNAVAYRRDRLGKQNEVINQAVITIPAYFNDKQKNATRSAAYKAGLTPLELLSEPTAAAISYGFKPDSDDVKTILVYDFGGGTFDASLIVAAGTQFIEQGKAGDLWLGGDDVDLKLTQFVKEQVAKQEGIRDIDRLIDKMPHYEKLRFIADLKLACEKAKVELSKSTSTIIAPSTPLKDDLGIGIPVEVEISRSQFEQMIKPLVARTIQICHEALQLSEYTPDLVDVVLLVGGSSQIPYVQSQVKSAFGNEKVVIHPRPMYAIAEGAAIVAAGRIDKVVTVSRDYCIKLVDDPHYLIIRRGDVLPIKTSHTFKLVDDGQRLIHFQFFSPDEVRKDLDGKSNDERIGDVWLSLDQDYPKGSEIQTFLELDEKESSLEVHAHLKNNPSVNVSSRFSRGESDEKVLNETESVIQELNELGLTKLGVAAATEKISAVVKAANRIVDKNTGKVRPDMSQAAKQELESLKVMMSKERLEAESYINEFERITNICGDLIPASQKQRIQNLSRELQEAIDKNNISGMQVTTERAEQEIENLPDRVKLIMLCVSGVRKASQINPSESQVMAGKLDRLITAMKNNLDMEVSRLAQELFPMVERYVDMPLSSAAISTGLSR